MSTLLLLLAPAASPGASMTVQNDAGSGTDAGDTRAEATSLPGPGAYDGRLLTTNDADWYELSFNETQPRCVSVSVTGDAVARVILELPGGNTSSLADTLTSTSSVLLPLTGSDVDRVRLGLVPQLTDLDPVGGPYQFDLRVLSAGDLPSPLEEKDAGDDLENATPLSGPCAGGHIGSFDPNGKAHFEDRDVYAFNASAGDAVVLSLTHWGYGDVELNLLDPEGNVHTSLLPGNLTVPTIDENGTWYLEVVPVATSSDWSANGYLLGIGLDPDGPDPEPRPCDPNC